MARHIEQINTIVAGLFLTERSSLDAAASMKFHAVRKAEWLL
jgi:hypothetical protein